MASSISYQSLSAEGREEESRERGTILILISSISENCDSRGTEDSSIPYHREERETETEAERETETERERERERERDRQRGDLI
jgi:hypothetical protein